MKPIIVNMKDMSDSTEVYYSKPNRFMIYTIYVILFIFIAIFIWMCAFKIDIVVKSDGVFRGSSDIYEISSGVTGKVKESNVMNGQYVNQGDILYVFDVDALSDTVIQYQNELEESKERLEMLLAYQKSLDGDIKELDVCVNNLYYDEFVNRRELLYANVILNESDTNGQASLYQGNIHSISETITKYAEKIDKLNVVKQCIMTHNNTLNSTEGSYYSMVVSYLASYNYTALQYDNRINEYQRQIDDCDKQIENVEGKNLKEQRYALLTAMESEKKERAQALLNLELQQIAAIEQQISEYNDTILTMEMNLTSARLQLEAIKGVDNDVKKSVAILTEKGNIAAEILNYQEKVEECNAYLKNYIIQNDNCMVRASVSGYYYAAQDLKTGTYVHEGTSLGTIYPEYESKYYAEIYVANSDIAKVKEGQEVKFEIVAYPSSKYGCFTGIVETIARDISIDHSSGNAYYKVKVKCDHMIVKDENGEQVSLKNGMACQSKIVIGEETVLTYLLEKIDLLD